MIASAWAERTVILDYFLNQAFEDKRLGQVNLCY
jgi:hypothetical protein